jgi:hypothetical protein
MDDLEFIYIPGKQWPGEIKADREANGRPCLEINKMPTFIAQVVGDQRMNRPSIKVIPVDNAADRNVATLLSGWIKHVQNISKSDIAVDHAFEHAVSCGYGAMRVVTKYSSDTSFEQEAYIEKIENALAVYWGKHQEYDCSDAEYCIIVTEMSRDEFKDTYGKEPMSFNVTDSTYVEGWANAKTVRLAEYFVKEPVEKTIYLLNDRRIVDELKEGDVEVKRRKVNTYKIKWYLCSGNEVLDEKNWVGKKYIPIIPVWGKEINVGGKKQILSLVRFGKDPQRMYNYWRSTDTEVTALQPRVPFFVTQKQIGAHKTQWDNMQRKNYPYILVDYDDKAPGWPKREAPPQASSAMAENTQTTDQEMRDTIGLQRASLGMHSNERSGIAIRERKQEGDVGTFSFIDNLSRSIEQLGRVLIDIAPGILDTERIIRLGQDNGDFNFDAVNVEDPNNPEKLINDLSVGTYDVVVTVGPSFTTQRTEARESMKEFIQYYPQAAGIIGDLYAKYQDWPGADEVASRLEFMLPPEIKEKIATEKAKKEGQEPPPPPEPPPPTPAQQMAMKEVEIKLQESQIKLQEMNIKLQIEQEKLKEVIIKNEMLAAESKDQIRGLLDEILKEEQEKLAILNQPPAPVVSQPTE